MTSILVVFCVLSIFAGISQCELRKIRACEGHIMELFCESNEVISVKWANYGRTESTFCNYFEDMEATESCRMEDAATDIVKKECNGKKSCVVEAINAVFGNPCPGQVKYVEAMFECLPKPKIQLDPDDITVEMQENELLGMLKDLGEKNSNGEDLKKEQALGLLNLFANAEADAVAEKEDRASKSQIWK